MKINKVSMLGAVLCIASTFLPWISLEGQSLNGFQMWTGKGPAYLFITIGVLTILFGYLNQKWCNIVSLILALPVIGLGLKYLSDAIGINATGFGLYVILLSGIVILAGSIMALIKKKSSTTLPVN